MRKSARLRGFTLIEVMIAVAIVAVLASIAYPSYTEHLRKQRRAEAQQVLMEIASRQQQQMLDGRSYTTLAILVARGLQIPDSAQAHYTFTVEPNTPTTSFTAVATPSGRQADDTCGTLSVTHANVKGPATCW